MLKRLKIEHFRNIRETELALGPLNVFIGPNGAGKSNFLDAVRFLYALFLRPIDSVVEEFGGATYLPTVGERKIGFEFELETQQQGWPLEGRIELLKEADGIFLHKSVEEYDLDNLMVQYDSEARSYLATASGASALLKIEQVPNVLRLVEKSYSGAMWSAASVDLPSVTDGALRVALKNLKLLLISEVYFGRFANLLALAGSHSMTSASTVRDWSEKPFEPSQLSSYYHWLWSHEDKRDDVRDLENFLLAAIPGYEGIVFPAAGEGQVQMSVKFSEAKRSLPLHALSDGIVALLCFAGFLYGERHSSPLAFEEPEVCLHPAAQQVMAEALIAESANRQIFVTTHSPTFLRKFPRESIVAVDVPSAHGTDTPVFRRLDDEKRLNSWLEKYDLGTAWEMGVLGAKP